MGIATCNRFNKTVTDLLLHNSLRRYLRDALRLEDWDVNMVGTKTRGEMKDNASRMHLNINMFLTKCRTTRQSRETKSTTLKLD